MRREVLGDLQTFLHDNCTQTLPSAQKGMSRARASYRDAAKDMSMRSPSEQGDDEESSSCGERVGGGIQFALGTLEDGTPMWYPPLNVLMLLGGLDLNPSLHGRSGRLWHGLVYSSRWFCLAVCIAWA